MSGTFGGAHRCWMRGECGNRGNVPHRAVLHRVFELTCPSVDCWARASARKRLKTPCARPSCPDQFRIVTLFAMTIAPVLVVSTRTVQMP